MSGSLLCRDRREEVRCLRGVLPPSLPLPQPGKGYDSQPNEQADAYKSIRQVIAGPSVCPNAARQPSGDWAGSATARSARNAKRLRQHQSPHCDTGSTYRAHRGKRQPALSESVALGGNRTRRVAGRDSEWVLAASDQHELITPIETVTFGAFVVASGSNSAICRSINKRSLR